MKKDEEYRKAKEVWHNGKIPVVLRRESKPTRIRIPKFPNDEEWLRSGSRKKKPRWDLQGKYWELPASRFNELVKMILHRFGKLYIIQPYREKEVCARACMEANGFECQCSCMGRNHGNAHSGGWFEVSDAFAVRFGDKRVACRLINSAIDF
jgi:hypothetical protein